MLAPSIVFLCVFFAYPLLFAVYGSFLRWDLLTPPTFVGLENYRYLWQSGELTGALWRTLVFSAVVLIGAVSAGLSLALALNRPGKVAGFLRGAVFAAYIVSWVSVGFVWLWLLDADVGAVARVQRALGFEPSALLSDPATALCVLGGVTVWKVTGYALVLFLAGLQDVDRSHLEAAALDGAGALERFWHVTWPALRPTVVFVCVTTLILSFQAFDVVRLMTDGGPVQSTTLLVFAIYEYLFVNLRMGRASAMVVLFCLMLLVLAMVRLAATRRRAAT